MSNLLKKGMSESGRSQTQVAESTTAAPWHLRYVQSPLPYFIDKEEIHIDPRKVQTENTIVQTPQSHTLKLH